VRTFFVYCQMGRNLYNWQHSKADWGGRWTCVLFDPKTKGLIPAPHENFFLIPQDGLKPKDYTVNHCESFCFHPEWFLNTLELIRHLNHKLRPLYYTYLATWLAIIRIILIWCSIKSYPQSYPQHFIL
jgi:hypothetical protein